MQFRGNSEGKGRTSLTVSVHRSNKTHICNPAKCPTAMSSITHEPPVVGYLRKRSSSLLVSLSVMILEVVTLTSTPSTMNLRVFFMVFF